MNIDNVKSWERVCFQTLLRLGMSENERPDVWVLSSHLDSNRPNKKVAWVAESLLYAYREMMRGDKCDWKIVIRCWGQAREYIGELEGLAACSQKSDVSVSWLLDALRNLQCDLEGRISK